MLHKEVGKRYVKLDCVRLHLDRNGVFDHKLEMSLSPRLKFIALCRARAI